MRNDEAFKRFLSYCDANRVDSAAKLNALADGTVSGVLWPDTAGSLPAGEHATPELAKRCMDGILDERARDADIASIEAALRAARISATVTFRDGNTFHVTLTRAAAVGGVIP